MSSPKSIKEVRELLLSSTTFPEQILCLDLPDFKINIHCDNEALASGLKQYFQAFSSEATVEKASDIDVYVVESAQQPFQLNWVDWSREQGKSGRKDLYFELPDSTKEDNARLIYKARTGMLFVQSFNTRIAFGPCLKNLNQVINFIINQFMNQLQINDWLICHSAALQKNQQGIAFAGFSGGGKSTTMLHLLNEDGFTYVTNDRLFIRSEADKVLAQGVPKLPRVNPGTLLNNQSLLQMLSDEERQEFARLSLDDLWQLEQKYDVDVAAIFGNAQNLTPHGLSHLVILNWHRNNTKETAIELVNLRENKELLDAVMKSKGPFYQYPNGQFYKDATALQPEQYLDVLKQVAVWEVTGKVDFDKVVQHFSRLLENG